MSIVRVDRPRRFGDGRRARGARRTAQIPDPGDLREGARRESRDGNAQARHVFRDDRMARCLGQKSEIRCHKRALIVGLGLAAKAHAFSSQDEAATRCWYASIGLADRALLELK